MKLRLPHQFQAALMAAIASVSLTTLSTGTAYATTLEDAALGLDDFTQASVDAAKAEGWSFSDTGIATESGVYTTTAASTTITSSTPWTTTATGGRAVYAALMTIDVSSLSTNGGVLLTSTRDDGTAREGIGYDYTGGTYKVESAWSGSKRSQGLINQNLANYADANGLVTVAIIYKGNQGTTGATIFVANQTQNDTGLKGDDNTTGNPKMLLANTTGVKYTNLYMFGMTDGNSITDADMQSMMKEAAAYYWTGSTDGNWDAATKNWTHYGSSVAVAIGANGGNANTNVVFGADATQKTVTLAGATTVGALTVSGGDYTFNLNGNLTTSGITIAQGASLAYTGSGNITGTLAGAGTYVLKSDESTLGSVTLGNDWTGTVKVTKNNITQLDLNAFGNANSTVEIDGWSSYLKKSDGYVYNPKLRLGTNGLTVADGYSNYSYTFAGGVEGEGNFKFQTTTTVDNQTYIFSGDVSKWTGSYIMNKSGKTTMVKFQGGATQIGAAITRQDGTLNVEVGDGTNAFNTTFEKAVNASKLEITNGASATFEKGVTLNGNLSLRGTETARASVLLKEGATLNSNIDLSNSRTSHGTVTVAAGKVLDFKGANFWMSTSSSIVLEQDAQAKLGSALTITGLSGAASSISNTSSDDVYGLNKAGFTLTNVEATVNSDQNDVQLRFDNSKYATTHNVTLKNLQSVFSGMDIQGGTTTVGASDATGAVTLGAVTLSGGANLAMADHVTGSVSSIDVTGSSAISGGTLSMGGTITTQENAQLTLGGTVLFADGGIATSGTGTLAFGDGVMFDLSQLTEGANHTYTLFTGNAVDLTSLNATAANHITGVITTGRQWTFNNNGQVSYEILSRKLMWKQAGGTGVWTTNDTETPWQVPGTFPPEFTYFNDGDEVTFAYTAEPAVATLGSDVTVSTLTLDTDTPNVTVNNDGSHSFSVEVLDIKSGRLTTNTEMAVKSVTIENGGVWNMGGDLDLTAITYSNAGTLNVMDGATVNISKDTDTSAITGAGTLYMEVSEVITYDVSFKEGSPFTGTLVYNEGDISNHNSYVSLDDTFKGTLELRGRMNGHAMNLGGASTLRLVGDRSSNTTGVWSQGAAMTFAQNLEVTGNEQVELWSDGGTIINGTVNSGTVKQGHLTKRENGTMTFNGAVALAEFTTPGGTVNFNSSAALDRININGGTVNLNGGADADYNLGQAWLSGGSLAIGANGVKSLTATDLVVRSSNTLNSAAVAATVFDVTNFDVSNYQTNFTLRNVTLNVSGAATAAVLNTAQNEDQATVTVDNKATLNLNGSVVWRKQDTAHSKLDFVNLTINNGGVANVNDGETNILNNVTVNAGGKLNFAGSTGTDIVGTLALADTITNAGTVTINGGSVAAGQAGTLTGSGTYNLNGTITNAGKLKLDGITVTGGGTKEAPATITGNVDISGGTIGGNLAIGSANSTVSILEAFNVANEANLLFDGHVVLDALEGSADVTYTEGQQDTELNGFIAGVSVKVYTPGTGVDAIFAGGVTYKGAVVYDFQETGTYSNISTSYDTFFVNTSGTTESLSHALTAAEGHGTMTAVQLANGTGLGLDSADAVLQHLVLKGGASATLNVTESATIGSLEGLGAAQALNVTGTAGKVLSISTTETMAGALSVTDATLKLNTNLTLAGGLDNAGTIDLNNKALTLNGQEGGTAYTMGKLTNGASSDVTLNNHVAATFDGEATVWRLTGNAGSSVVVGENATLTLASTNRNYYSQVSDLDVKGTISLKGSNGDIRFYGYEDNQVFNLGHLHIDGNSGTTYMLTAGSVNYSTDIVVKSLSGGGANHTLQVSDCYNGGSQGMVIDLIIGETQDSTNLYTGKIQYGIGTGSALAGSGMNLVIKDELVASKAVLDPVFSGNNAQSANITVDTAHAQVKGLTGTVNNARTMQVSGTEAGKNRVLEIVGEGNYTYGGKLGANLDVVHSGAGTQSFGGVDGFDGSLDVEAGTLNIMNIAQAASLSVQDVTISNSTLGVYTNATAAEANEGTLTIKDGHTLTASGANAKLNANLVMESGSTLDVSAYGGTGGLHMGSSITLNPGMFLSDKDMEGVSGLGFMDAYDLKYGVDEFFIGSTQYSEITFASETWVKASDVFSNDGFKDGKDYYVFYSGANPGGNGGNVGTIYIVQVPEPATSTLSLLALAALAARRRRK